VLEFYLFADADMDHKDCDCFAVSILSHGDEGMVFATNEPIEIKKLVEPLKSSKTLVGKPKLFFIQVGFSVCFLTFYQVAV